MTDRAPQPIRINIYFPWASVVTSLAALCFFFLLKNPEFLAPQILPPFSQMLSVQFFVLFCVLFVMVADLQRFLKQKRTLNQKVTETTNELAQIWESKKKLQERSHIYSGHADKLKRFISDKLLDYIEYDETFLHFKNIAAEVRHNGVISYDIVKSALEKAAAGVKTTQPAPINFADTHRFGLPNNPNSDYQQALDAMKYLWDLLDLSTAENIALHIGNGLIECEEKYYFQELTHQSGTIETNSDKPYFSPAFAIIKTISPLLEPREIDRLIAVAEHSNKSDPSLYQSFASERFHIKLQKTDHLLGNENHLILLLENLIKNAQFFSTKNKFKQKSDRIALQLSQRQGYIQITLYNRGPLIPDETVTHIFDLGYSTRRVKEHHGKGLGLFFVKEIVKGYQGKITVTNVRNTAKDYLIRILLSDGQVIPTQIATSFESDRPRLQNKEKNESTDTLLLTFTSAILSIEVIDLVQERNHLLNDISSEQKLEIIDTSSPLAPQWKIEITPKRKAWDFSFAVLDKSGVEFSVNLPSAEARLSGTEATFMEDFEKEVETLNQQFSEFDDY